MMQQTVSGSLSNSYLNSLFKFSHFALDAASVDHPSSTFNLIAAANNHASWDTTTALDSKSNVVLRSPELSDSIHMLSVKVMHTAVTGGSHHIPSNPSHHINFAWASGALWIFIISSFPPTTRSSARSSGTNTNTNVSASQAHAQSITQVLADNPTLGHVVAQSCIFHSLS